MDEILAEGADHDAVHHISAMNTEEPENMDAEYQKQGAGQSASIGRWKKKRQGSINPLVNSFARDYQKDASWNYIRFLCWKQSLFFMPFLLILFLKAVMIVFSFYKENET